MNSRRLAWSRLTILLAALLPELLAVAACESLHSTGD